MKKRMLALGLALAMTASMAACGSKPVEQTMEMETISNEVICVVGTYWTTPEGMFKGTTLFVHMPDGSIHTYEEPWVASEIIQEISFDTKGTDSYEEWEVIPPSSAIE